MLNLHGFIEQDHQEMATQVGGFCLSPTNLVSNFAPLVSHQQPSFKPFTTLPCPFDIDHATSTLTQALLSSTCPKPRDDFFVPSNLPLLGSHQRYSPDSWAWGEGKDYQGISKMNGGGDLLGVSSTMKKKKIKGRRKMREPRFCFKTMSDVDVLDDGYKWRKYGQKVVKNTLHPRSYYRCTQDNCRVKKRVERLAEDPRMVITTYEGRHVHSPSHDLHDSAQSAQTSLTNFFW